MKEQLITFETAKLAKEKGFDKELGWNEYFYHPDNINNPFHGSEKSYPNELNYNDYSLETASQIEFNNWEKQLYKAPTQSLLQKWLREGYKIEIQIFTMGVYINSNTSPYSGFKVTEGFKKYNYGLNSHKHNTTMGYDTYELALEAALQNSLEII